MTMRQALLLSPLAMIASACALQPSTPSMSTTLWSERPYVTFVQLPARSTALRRWLLPPTDPWAGYAKYTLLTALGEAPEIAELPDVEGLGAVQRARSASATVAASGLPPDTLWVVDMRGAASVAFGTELSRSTGGVSLVPTFNNWPARNELVPAEETLSALASMSPDGPGEGGEATHPVFLLDAWRMAHRFDEPGDETYDNRYFLSTSDLPDVDTLRARGIRRVVYVVESLGETNVEEDDLHPVFLEWERAGIRVAMMDLDSLEHPITSERWDDVFVDRYLAIEPRVPIFGEPSFYVRARGGFGGMNARPSAIGIGGGGYGSHGGGG
ncbi:MAG: hypothetical protein ACLP1X_20620 [Polyangiaceae bacterium]|jgi:hypothetical protein